MTAHNFARKAGRPKCWPHGLHRPTAASLLPRAPLTTEDCLILLRINPAFAIARYRAADRRDALIMWRREHE